MELKGVGKDSGEAFLKFSAEITGAIHNILQAGFDLVQAVYKDGVEQGIKIATYAAKSKEQ